MDDRQRLAVLAGVVLLLSTLAGVVAGHTLLGRDGAQTAGAPKVQALAESAPVATAAQDTDGVAMLQLASEAALAETGGVRVMEIEYMEADGTFEVEVLLEDGRELKVFLDGAYEVMTTGQENGSGERTVAGATLEEATAAALRHTGGGRVVGIEVGDELGAYEVDVALPNGKVVEVHLDEDFGVVGQR